MFLIPKDWWEIRQTDNKGRGVFAKRDIPAGTVIGDYIGILTESSHVKEPSHLFYEFYFNEDVSIMPQKDQIGIHLINHSCMPNCDSYPYRGHTILFALRHIFAGEEFSYSYLLEPSNTEKDVCHHICHCGTPLCKGTMHTPEAFNEKWDEYVDRAQREYNKTLPVPIGSVLPLLESYPHTIPDDTFYDLFASVSHPSLSVDHRSFEAEHVRSLLRQSGRRIKIDSIGLTVCAFMNGMVICENSS